MENHRIYVNGNYNGDGYIVCEIIQHTFFGPGALDYKKNTIFKGIEKFIKFNVIDCTDAEFEEFEKKVIEYFEKKYCTKGQELIYLID